MSKSSCLLCLFFLLVSCTSSPKKVEKVDEYLEKNPDLSSQKIVAMRSHQIVNGMTEEEVSITLGTPTFVEKKTEDGVEQRWVYRSKELGKSLEDVYTPQSAFPQGIVYVLPFYYRPREVRVDFKDGKVFQVQEILSF